MSEQLIREKMSDDRSDVELDQTIAPESRAADDTGGSAETHVLSVVRERQIDAGEEADEAADEAAEDYADQQDDEDQQDDADPQDYDDPQSDDDPQSEDDALSDDEYGEGGYKPGHALLEDDDEDDFTIEWPAELSRELNDRLAEGGPDLRVVYSGQVDEVLAAADQPRASVSLDLLYDFAQEFGIDADSRVVDVGCADGQRSRELIRRTGCRVEGIEILPQLIQWGEEATAAAGLTDRLTIDEGTILDLPVPDSYADAVWCTDVLSSIDDLPTAVSECARVLRPGGLMIVYVTLATPRLAAFEQAELDASQGTVAASMDRPYMQACLGKHFDVERTVVIGARGRLHSEEHGDHETTSNLVRAARLLTWADQFRGDHGELAHRTALTEAFWGVYQLLGKLEPTVYVLRKREASASEDQVAEPRPDQD